MGSSLSGHACLYGYVLEDPINTFDPRGLQGVDVCDDEEPEEDESCVKNALPIQHSLLLKGLVWVHALRHA
jgi:hypothetical protein